MIRGGVKIVKVYKSKDKLIVYLPFEVVRGLRIGENDEVDFFKAGDNTFIFAKKSDVASLLLGKEGPEGAPRQQPSAPAQQRRASEAGLTQEELDVLRKLDTLRYGSRDVDSVNRMLSDREKEVLSRLIVKKAVLPFRKDMRSKELYSISKEVYDKFLMRKKKAGPEPAKIEEVSPQIKEAPFMYVRNKMPENENVKKLEKDGFVIVSTEGEASSLSLALEESIRRGLVLGTRAFNKKFYVVLRQYFDRHATAIIKDLKDKGESRVSSIARDVGISEDGARAILCLLSENGDVSEKKKDLFTLA
ncbi:MAG: hypothetical protein KGH72_00115 [Candidatus Micrarchaeota archaeon]|nr:hypothetical protein [Candidatus Micrarchaeota archaeon]